MNITFEQSGVVGVLTVKLEKADYQNELKKELKDMSAKAELPGFRPGKVPVSLIQKRFGAQTKAALVDRILQEKMMNYIETEKVNMIGFPMMSEQQQPQDIEKQDDFEFVFDIALAPDFEIELGKTDSVDYYEIDVTEEMVNEQVKNYAQQAGHPESVETYENKDILRGAIAEQDAEGNLLEGGINLEKVSLMPAYFKSDEQKKHFEGAKVNDVITFNPSEAHSETEFAALLKVSTEEAANHKGNFTFQVDEISRFVASEMNQELYDRYFEVGTVKSEEEFRTKVKEGLQMQHTDNSDYKFLLDLRKYCEEKVGELTFPVDLLKRVMQSQHADKDAEYVERNFEKSIVELKWHLIRDKIVQAEGITVNDAEVKEQAIEYARLQFMQYGMNNIPQEYLEQYALGMLKNKEQIREVVERCLSVKLIKALKEKITLNKKSISFEDFQELFEN